MNNLIYCKDVYNIFLSMLSPRDILKMATLSSEFKEIMLHNQDYNDLALLYRIYHRVHIVDVCRHGFVNLIKYFDTEDIKVNADIIFTNAVDTANFEILDLVKSYSVTPFTIDDTINCAIRNSLINVLEWLYKNGFALEIDQYHIRDICCRQNILILDWLEAHNQELHAQHAIKLAAEHGKLSIIKWYDVHNYVTDYDIIFSYALHNARLDVTDWLVEKYQYRPLNLDQYVLSCVTYCNYFSLEWLHNQYHCSLHAIAESVYRQGKCVLLEWLKTDMHFDFATLSIRSLLILQRNEILVWLSQNTKLSVCVNLDESFNFRSWFKQMNFAYMIKDDRVIFSIDVIVYAMNLTSKKFVNWVINNVTDN